VHDQNSEHRPLLEIEWNARLLFHHLESRSVVGDGAPRAVLAERQHVCTTHPRSGNILRAPVRAHAQRRAQDLVTVRHPRLRSLQRTNIKAAAPEFDHVLTVVHGARSGVAWSGAFFVIEGEIKSNC
jgi:hypothetical protein